MILVRNALEGHRFACRSDGLYSNQFLDNLKQYNYVSLNESI